MSDAFNPSGWMNPTDKKEAAALKSSRGFDAAAIGRGVEATKKFHEEREKKRKDPNYRGYDVN